MKKITDNTNFYTGLFLLLLGLVFLADNFNIVDVSIKDIFKLWPFVLIVWGLSYLPIKGFWRFLVNLAMIMLFFILLFSKNRLTGNSPFNARFSTDKTHTVTGNNETYNVNYSANEYYFVGETDRNIKKAVVKLVVPASEFKIEEQTDNFYEFIAEEIPYEIKENIRFEGDKAVLEFLSPKKTSVNRFQTESRMEMKLNPDIIWSFDISSGASDLELDLRKFKTEEIKIATGASKIDITLGDKQDIQKIKIDSGASDVHISVPEHLGIEAKTNNFLGLNQIDDLKKIKKGLFRSENFDKASGKIYIEINSALSGFELERY
jgi:hypothetical protein